MAVVGNAIMILDSEKLPIYKQVIEAIVNKFYEVKN